MAGDVYPLHTGPWRNVLVYDATGNPISSTSLGGGNYALDVAIVAGGGSGGTSAADESLFSTGVTLGTPAMGADTTANEAVILEVYPGSRTLQTLLMALSAGAPAAVAFGQALMAASLPVTIASNQSAIPVTGSISVAPVYSHTVANGGLTTVTTDALLLAQNLSRVGYSVQNVSTVVIYVLEGTGTCSATNFTYSLPACGVALDASSPYHFDSQWQGPVRFCAASGTGKVAYEERV